MPPPSTALATRTTVLPAYVYEAIDPVTKLPFYVGRTGDMDRRAREHQKRCMKKVRELMKLKNFRFRDVQRRVPELPDGCAPEHAQELETYFIFQRKVIYDPVDCPWGCNSRIGDHGTEMTPERFAELTAMFAGEGYQFPLVEEPKDLRDARAEYEIAGEFVAMAEKVGDEKCAEELNKCRVLAKSALLNAERIHLGLRAFVEVVLADYEDKHVDAVDQSTLQTALNLIKDKMAEDAAFIDLQRIVTSMSLVCKEKEGVDVSSEAAANGLKMVLAMIRSREEATMAWTNKTVEAKIKAVRTWTRAHGMQKPTTTSVDKEEQRLAGFLNNWKGDNDHYGGKCTDLSNCSVVMRGIQWFEDFVGSVDKKANDWVELNKQLCDGYAWYDEPDFEGKKAIPTSKGNKTIYDKLINLIKGHGKPPDVAIALKGLPPIRAAYYQGQYDANRSAYLQEQKEAYKKKRKRESVSSSSTTDNPDEEE
jgi:hypothetical protein